MILGKAAWVDRLVGSASEQGILRRSRSVAATSASCIHGRQRYAPSMIASAVRTIIADVPQKLVRSHAHATADLLRALRYR